MAVCLLSKHRKGGFADQTAWIIYEFQAYERLSPKQGVCILPHGVHHKTNEMMVISPKSIVPLLPQHIF